MELYIGGCYQGKTQIVQGKYPNAKVYDENSFDENSFNENSLEKEVIVINRFHLIIKKLVSQNYSREKIDELVNSLIESETDNLVIICDEIGNGIVPITHEEREYREMTGRQLARLAEKSQRVVRVICGLEMIIK